MQVPAPAFLKAAQKGSGDRVVAPTTGTIQEASLSFDWLQGARFIRMPVCAQVLVAPGDVVEMNQPLVKMESMKMLVCCACNLFK